MSLVTENDIYHMLEGNCAEIEDEEVTREISEASKVVR